MKATITKMGWYDRDDKPIPDGRSRFTLEVDVEKGTAAFDALIDAARGRESITIAFPEAQG